MKTFEQLLSKKVSIIYKKTKTFRLDIDPYGEENWDEDNIIIDWDNINIVHPTSKNDIGKNVLIIDGSRYYSDDSYNPKDTIGTIIKMEYNIQVLWSTGFLNSYDSDDLTLIEYI